MTKPKTDLAPQKTAEMLTSMNRAIGLIEKAKDPSSKVSASLGEMEIYPSLETLTLLLKMADDIKKELEELPPTQSEITLTEQMRAFASLYRANKFQKLNASPHLSQGQRAPKEEGEEEQQPPSPFRGLLGVRRISQ